MAVNRFFNPSRGEYISQFVPQELPTNLMMGVLGTKQKGYDNQQANLFTLGEWNQKALEGYDTEYVKGKKKEIESFINKAYETDISSPESIRNYMGFISKFKKDEGLNQVAGAVQKDEAFWKRISELKKSKDTADYADELANEYLTRRKVYTKDATKGGLGFTGEIGLGDHDVLTGNDLIGEAKKLFDDIKGSGSENARLLEQGIHYKEGWEGVSGATIDNRVSQMLNAFKESASGDQLIKKRNMELFGDNIPSVELSKFTPEQRKAYDRDINNYIGDFLTKAGGEFKYGKSTTNIDQAKNKVSEWNREDLKEFPQQPIIETKGFTTGYQMPNWEQTFGTAEGEGMYAKNNKIIAQEATNLKTYQNLVNFISTNSMTGRKPSGLDPAVVKNIQNIPGGIELINGQPISADKREILIKELTRYSEDSNMKLNESNRINNQIKEKLGNAALMITDKQYNGRNIKEVHDDYDKLGNDEVVARYKAEYEKYMQMGATQTANDFLEKNIKAMRDNINNKKITNPAQAKRVFDGLLTMQNYNKAEKDLGSMLSNPKQKEQLQFAYGKVNEYVPTASLKPTEKYFMAYDSKGNKVGKTLNSDYIIEDLAKKDPSAFVIYDADTHKRIMPTMIDPETNQMVPNPDFPKGEFLQLVSADKEMLNDYTAGEKMGTKAQFNFTAQVPTTEFAPNPLDPKKIVKSNTTTTKRYKVVANGMTTKNYTEAKAKEAYSNYQTDPNTEAGKQSFIDYQMWSNPERAKSLSQINGLTKEGQKTFTPVNLYNVNTHQPEQYEVRATKLPDGGFDVSIHNDEGDVEVKDTKFKNIIDISNYLQSLENATKQAVDKAKEMGVTPDPKAFQKYLKKKTSEANDQNIVPEVNDLEAQKEMWRKANSNAEEKTLAEGFSEFTLGQ